MKNKKSPLQKFSIFLAIFSFIASIVCVIYLTLKIDTLGWENPVSASLLASSFFFGFICLVFIVIGTANVPNFKFGEDSK